MRNVKVRVSLYIISYVVTVAIVLFITKLTTPNSLSTITGVSNALSNALEIITPFFGLLIVIIELGFKPSEETTKTILNQVNLPRLYKYVTDKGEIPWIDRGLVEPDDFYQHPRILIRGKLKRGKTREAIELIRRAQGPHFPEGAVFVPEPYFRSMDVESIEKSLRDQFSTSDSLLVFFDELIHDLYHYSGKEKKMPDLIEAIINGLKHCPKVIFVATGREEEISGDIDIAKWLEDHKFHPISIPDPSSQFLEKLVYATASHFDLQVDAEAVTELTSPQVISPEQIILGLRYIKQQGNERVNRDDAHNIVNKKLQDLWAQVRNYLIHSCFEEAAYLFASLDIFHAAKVTKFKPLVLDYSVHLWREGRSGNFLLKIATFFQSPLIRIQLNRVLRILSGYISVEDKVVQISDAAVEGQEKPAKAIDVLANFLLHHRRIFRNRVTRRFYSHAENHAWALFELALSSRGKMDQPGMIDLYSAALGFYPFYGYFNNRGLNYAALCEYDCAKEDYSRAIELNPNDAAAYYNLGLLLHEKIGRAS